MENGPTQTLKVENTSMNSACQSLKNLGNMNLMKYLNCLMNKHDCLIKTAFMYLNAPYLWGGKSPFGIDCSGFTQMVYKLNGYKLFRSELLSQAQNHKMAI